MKAPLTHIMFAYFMFALFASIPIAISQTQEKVKLASVEAIASPTITDVGSAIAIQTFVKLVSKC